MTDLIDSWLFLAVARANGESLEALIAMADAIDHSVLNYSEFSTSIPRLASAGLVACNGESIGLTEVGHALFASLGGAAQPCIAQVTASRAAVARAVAGARHAGTATLVSPERFSEAVAAYLGRASKWR